MFDRAGATMAQYAVGSDSIKTLAEPSTLDELAASPHWYERRTAIVATWFFLRRGETADTFRIGAVLAGAPVRLVRTAVRSWVREAGKRDPAGLQAFRQRTGISGEAARG